MHSGAHSAWLQSGSETGNSVHGSSVAAEALGLGLVVIVAQHFFCLSRALECSCLREFVSMKRRRWTAATTPVMHSSCALSGLAQTRTLKHANIQA